MKLPFLILFAGLLAGSVSVAEDPPDAPSRESPAESTPEEPKAADPAPGQPAAEDESNEKGDQKKNLEDGLESLDPTASDRDLLEEAIRGMRKAQELLEGEKTGGDTRQVQDQVVKDLDELIKQLQQQLQNPQNQSQSSKNDKNRQKKPLASVQRPKPKPMPKPQPGEKKPEGDKPGDQSKETSESQEERKRAEAEEARRRKLSQDVWGHLPQHLRDELMNVYTEKYLPKYAELVRQYYESLAEQSRGRVSQ